jgi:hypothetical protein
VPLGDRLRREKITALTAHVVELLVSLLPGTAGACGARQMPPRLIDPTNFTG